jgi:signal transduction histidine kinase
VRILQLNADVMRGKGGRVTGLMGTMQDITERRRMEREILDGGARERQAIAQELHDSLGQQLTGMAFLSKALARKAAGESLPLSRDAARLADLAGQAVHQVRRIAYGLFPVDIGAEGDLGSALRGLCGTVAEASGLVCRCVVGRPGLVHNRVTATHLYRIVQEAVNNAVRHGKAGHVTVHLTTGRTGRLTIRDDGSGIPDGAQRRHGMGLRVMAHRASVINGTFSAERHPAGGTVVICTFPNDRPARPGAGVRQRVSRP